MKGFSTWSTVLSRRVGWYGGWRESSWGVLAATPRRCMCDAVVRRPRGSPLHMTSCQPLTCEEIQEASSQFSGQGTGDTCHGFPHVMKCTKTGTASPVFTGPYGM